MAGMNVGRRSRPGYTIDPKTGALVPLAMGAEDPSADMGMSALRPGSKSLSPGHEWGMDPTGQSAQQTYVGAGGMNYGTKAGADGSWGGYSPMGAGGATAAGGSSNSDATRHQALSALEAQIRGQMGQTNQPQQTPVVTSKFTGNDAADRAVYGGAKERVGLALKSALKGLRESMSSRGLAGSGIEGEATGNLYANSLGDLAETDRALATANGDRLYQSGQADTDRTINQNQFNAGALERAQAAARSGTDRSLEMLLQIARSY